jgi:vacuolar-type H+-ATPase subunit I/STV1
MLGVERLMAWGLVLSFAVGALCALRVPILHFTIIVLAIVVGYAVMNIGTGSSAIDILSWAALLAVILEAGYIFPHLLFYVVYVKLLGRERRRSPDLGSGFFSYSPFSGHQDKMLPSAPEGVNAETKAGPRIQD